MLKWFKKKTKQLWCIYKMNESPGSVYIIACYTTHDDALRELYTLRGQFPNNKYGLQQSKLNPKFTFDRGL
ncbi:hypothetical protein D3C75_786730 [compost metagenome]